MKKIVSCREMKALDEQTIETYGVPSCVLMERAALAVVEEFQKAGFVKDKSEARILVVCGSGNNGGDGYAIARLLHLAHYRVTTMHLGNTLHMSEGCRAEKKTCEAYGVPETDASDYSRYTVIIDALFGIGLSREVTGAYAAAIEAINSSPAKKIAVDIPSGIQGDRGSVNGCAVKADLTVTFAYRKRGMCIYPGRRYCGKLVVKDIGIYDIKNEVTAHALEPSDLYKLPKRNPGGNKGTFGKVLFVAGSEGMCGAAYLSASAALHCGAGMVQIQTAEANRIPLQMLLPEAILSTTFTEKENTRLLSWCNVVVLGPGLGQSPQSESQVLWYLTECKKLKKPLVIDADGLNLVAAHPEWKSLLGPHTILTPHMGEMSRLLSCSILELKDRVTELTQEFAKESNSVVVCKDACTVIADYTGSLFYNLSGNDGMATAGSGDVLSGILGGILCMDFKNPEFVTTAAASGVFVHGLAGDLAAEAKGRHSMTARDLIDRIADVFIGGKTTTER